LALRFVENTEKLALDGIERVSIPGLMQMKLTAGFGLTPLLDWNKLGYGQRNIKTRSH